MTTTAVARKKTILLDQDLLSEARQLLAARTETEAVHQALDAVVRRERQIRGLEELARLGPVDASRVE